MAFPDPDRWTVFRLARPLALATALAVTAASMVGSTLAQDDDSAPEASPASEASPLPDGFNKKMAKKVTEVIDAVHPVRRLPAADDVSYRVIDKETFLVELEALFREEYSAEYIAAEDDAYTRLGLL